MAEDFKIGDVVQLNSGGPKMTVTNVLSKEQYVHTTWFAGSKKENGGFPFASVKLYSEEKKL